jgi:hypothetical protein
MNTTGKYSYFNETVSQLTRRRYWSVLALCVSGFFFIRNAQYVKRWEEPNSPIQWDVISYYEYLPSIFIHHDWSLSFLDEHPELEGKYWHSKGPDNSRVIRTSMGMSLLYLPFFVAGHISANALGYPTDGFSDPYEVSLIYGSIIYCLIALWILRNVLRRYVSDFASALTILSLSIGTNLFYYTSVEGPMSHAWLFMLYAALLYCTIRLNESGGKSKYFYFISLLSGVMVLCRPTEIVVIIIVLLYGIRSIKDFIAHFRKLVIPYHRSALGILLFVAPFFLQMCYWKDVTGTWLYYSYQEYGFFFDSPMIVDGLFSYRKGWLVYTPLASFFLFGFILLYKRQRQLFWPIIVWCVANIYITFSWCIWWYGGSFGMRALIQGTALLSINMALLYDFALRNYRYFFWVIILGFYFIRLNLFQTRQFLNSLIHWDSMTKDAYWYVFERREMTRENWTELEGYLQAPDYEARTKK